MLRLRLLAALLPSLLLATNPAWAQRITRRVDPGITDRVIVKWRDSGVAAVLIPTVEERTARLGGSTGLALTAVRNLHDRLDVMRLPAPMLGGALQAVIAQLRADPSVEYAEPDARRFVEALPNDPHFYAGSDSRGQWEGQWYLLPSSSTTPAAIGATTAWDTTMGSASTVVAVIDTGVRFDHPDLGSAATGGKLLAGYDFVSCDNVDITPCGSSSTYLTSNDGGGWDPDPSDPGDWISSADLTNPIFKGCGQGDNKDQPYPSSWHGTRVAGIIGALTNNGRGVAGVAPNVLILPVRAVGKCTGYISDIVAAMRWAAGLAVSGAPANPNPAKIMNLSLGSNQPCSTTEQSAVNDVLAAGTLIVVSAGNDGGPVNSPANCTGVLSVAGLRHTGTKVGYSSVSSATTAIAIAAPAGNCVNVAVTSPCVYSIETTTNDGSTAPDTTTPESYTYAAYVAGDYTTSGGTTTCDPTKVNCEDVASVGTSFSAPLVAGTAALMLGANSALTASQIIARLKSSAAPFPTSSSTSSTACAVAPVTTDSSGSYTDTSQMNECVCTTATCGAGMLNAAAAVQAATGASVIISLSTTTASLGQKVTLSGTNSTAAAGHNIVAWQWSAGSGVSVANANQPVAYIVFPNFRPVTVVLTITDDQGVSLSTSATIEPASGSNSSSSGSSTGGGGPMGGFELVLLAGMVLLRLARHKMQGRTHPFSG
jgi:serine protease